ncbi:hypothetical protein NEHOM01_0888 [Nematocida homosporus]|uniref:uncharacterized protein n=1 Tax=Nematocida homosporus TaxID=1912981 RepID=UPI00221EF195|nr:uncharacterized protein NEHOM01_0888 [Nematocida homosporus]KAI5185529.1 hypothetical protein NEHOM01_0888 [Nematocida homosporus]
MGFILSRLYRGPTFAILVLKPFRAKRYTVVDEFLSLVLKGHKVLIRHQSEYLTYHKISFMGRNISVLEMHDEEKADLFWDCIQNMNAVAYFIGCVEEENWEQVLSNIESIKNTHESAPLLLIVVRIGLEESRYVTFKRQIKKVLEERSYKIVDGARQVNEELAPSKETICQGLSWVLLQK